MASSEVRKAIDIYEKNSYIITATSYEKINEVGDSLSKTVKVPNKIDYNRILLDCPVGNSTVIYNAQEIGQVQIPNIRKRNDDALWLTLLKKEKYIYGLNEVLMYYRVRPDSISANKFKLIKYHWILYREIEKLSIPRSIFHIVNWFFIKLFKLK